MAKNNNNNNNTLLWLGIGAVGLFVALNPNIQTRILAGGGGSGGGSPIYAEDTPSSSLTPEFTQERDPFFQVDTLRTAGAEDTIRVIRGDQRSQIITSERDPVANFISRATEAELSSFGNTQITITDNNNRAEVVFDLEERQSRSAEGGFSIAPEFGGGVGWGNF